MADDVNIYRVVGTLTAPPKFNEEKKNPVRLEVRTVRGFTKSGGEAADRTVNHRVKCWGAHAASAATLREGDRVEAVGEFRVEGRDVGEGDDKKTYYDHLCVVDDEEDGAALNRV